jgi:hypothetical protein
MGKCSFPKAKPNIDYGVIRSHQYFLKFMVAARDSHAKAAKPKKGGEATKITKGLVLYSEKFQASQIEMLKLLRGQVVDGEINPAWRNEVKIESKEEKTKILKFGGWIEKEFKAVGEQVLEETLPFNELKVLSSFASNIKKEFPV